MRKVVLIFFGMVALQSSAYAQKFQQQDDLYYELPDSNDVKNKNFFNLDNSIYRPGLEFKFSYQIIKNGDSSLIRVGKIGDTKTSNWTFVKKQNSDSMTIQCLGFKTLDGYGGLDQLFPDYCQTVIQQDYYFSVHQVS